MPLTPGQFDALIFDCDGVLVNSEEIIQALELEMLSEMGLHYDRDEFSRRFLGTSDEHFFSALSADSEKTLGHPLPETFKETLHERARLAYESRLSSFEGTTELIEAWTGRLAVASSSTLRALHFKLALTGLREHFGEHIYSADHVGIGKPDPAIYLHTASAMGVNPSRCIVVEDSINGVLSAHHAGMTVVGFTAGKHCSDDHGDQLMEAGATSLANSMHGLSAFLAGNN